jgi:thymidylate synthase (FAD)
MTTHQVKQGPTPLHSVRLVHITPDAEQLIAYMARVSNPANQNNTETSAKLIKYLIDHKHWSPFEMVNMCVEIETTRSVAAQILRHRSFSFQEFSQRYAEVQLRPELPEMRRQDLKNRQNSVDDLSLETLKECDEVLGKALVTSYRAYERLLELGVAKECAREVLPLCTPTKLYMNGTIRSWIHYCQLRCANGTQKEHQIIAREAYKLLEEHLPNVCVSLDV